MRNDDPMHLSFEVGTDNNNTDRVAAIGPMLDRRLLATAAVGHDRLDSQPNARSVQRRLGDGARHLRDQRSIGAVLDAAQHPHENFAEEGAFVPYAGMVRESSLDDSRVSWPARRRAPGAGQSPVRAERC